MKSDLTDLTMMLHHVTERAILVSDDGDRDKAVWLPLSKVDVEHTNRKERGNPVVVVTVPAWLATEKGLV